MCIRDRANVARADEAISCLPDSDLFVLPEMFSTGFCTQPEGIADVYKRQELVEGFKQGRIRVLVNVDIFSEGFDCPDVEFVQLARDVYKRQNLYTSSDCKQILH